MENQSLLYCDHVQKNYLGKEAVKDLSLSLQPGKVYALLGPNGSGKTTLMKMITGLVKPTSGKIYYYGTPLSVETRHHIAYMSTEPYFYSYMKVQDAGKYYQDFFPDFQPGRFTELLSLMELSPKDKIRSMSSGMVAKMKIALTLARDTDVYLLDEPLNGIDLIARDLILRTVQDAYAMPGASASDSTYPGRTFILSSHLVEEMEPLIDVALFMKQGTLADVRSREDLAAGNEALVDLYKQIYSGTGPAPVSM